MIRAVVLAVLLLVWAHPSSAELSEAGQATVVGVVDGDTVVLEDGRQVRLVGIQAPKLPLSRPNFVQWPLADEAKARMEELTLGKRVTLRHGGAPTDRHGRLLAHLYLPDGVWVQGAMLSEGLARVYTFADNIALADQMYAAERAARDAGRGIWGLAYYRVRGPDDLQDDIGSFQVIEGTVYDTADVRGTVYLNFAADWRHDFTIMAKGRERKAIEAAGLDLLALKGKRVRVRGWLKDKNGPMIELNHAEALEPLAD